MSEPVFSPAGNVRPAQSEVLQAASTTVVTALSTIAAWITGMLLDLLPVVVPSDVRAAFVGLTLIGVAFGVSLAAVKMRNSEWRATGEVTGAKQLM